MHVAIKEYLKTSNKESLRTKTFRILMNWYPMFFGTGGKILFWSSDWSEVHLKLSLNMWTRNYVGTIFGGSMFSVTDPFYMLMFFHILGDEYVVWDKSANIQFKRPGKAPLYAKLKVDSAVVEKIKAEVAAKGETNYVVNIKWIDQDHSIYAELDRTIYAASKSFYKEKLQKRKEANAAPRLNN